MDEILEPVVDKIRQRHRTNAAARLKRTNNETTKTKRKEKVKNNLECFGKGSCVNKKNISDSFFTRAPKTNQKRIF